MCSSDVSFQFPWFRVIHLHFAFFPPAESQFKVLFKIPACALRLVRDWKHQLILSYRPWQCWGGIKEQLIILSYTLPLPHPTPPHKGQDDSFPNFASFLSKSSSHFWKGNYHHPYKTLLKLEAVSFLPSSCSESAQQEAGRELQAWPLPGGTFLIARSSGHGYSALMPEDLGKQLCRGFLHVSIPHGRGSPSHICMHSGNKERNQLKASKQKLKGGTNTLGLL